MKLALPVALAAMLAAEAHASASVPGQINTGPATGVYHASFCPVLAAHLKVAQFDYRCATSAGTRENMTRVLSDPRQLGFGQLDVFALESRRAGTERTLSIVRQDDARECVFAATRNRDISTFGELSAHAGRLRFILPPQDTDSAGTFQFLAAIDRDGLGSAKSVIYAASASEAIRQALSADDTVTLFVQFADPDSELFELVRQLGGQLVPVIDRAILRQEVAGKKIYFAQETQIANAEWTKSGSKLVTACTPLVLFTGHPERIQGEQARKDHEDLIRTLSALQPGALLPHETTFQRLLKRTKELSARSTEKLLEVSEQAREKAKPLADKAREAAEQAKDAAARAAEAAKPYIDKSKEEALKAYERALEAAKGWMEKAKPETPPNRN
jgi:hypothetical protein